MWIFTALGALFFVCVAYMYLPFPWFTVLIFISVCTGLGLALGNLVIRYGQKKVD